MDVAVDLQAPRQLRVGEVGRGRAASRRSRRLQAAALASQ